MMQPSVSLDLGPIGIAQATLRAAVPDYAEDLMLVPTDAASAIYGDFASPLAFSLARAYKKSPQIIAEEISSRINTNSSIVQATAVNGYINLSLAPQIWQEALRTILAEQSQYGKQNIGQGAWVNVEYVSANPTGPLHAAHARGAILGDVIANLLEAIGYRVVREYFINDAGQQIRVLVNSILYRCQALSLQKEVVIPEGMYPGLYVQDIAQALMQHYPDWKQRSYDDIARFSVDFMMKDIRQDLDSLGIHHDIFVSEQHLHDEQSVDAVIELLRQKDLVYRGTLPPPQGQENNDWIAEEMLLFRSSRFGDEQDRPLQRPDGLWTYFAGDIAYHMHKHQREYSHMINVWGADHASHVQRMKAAFSALTQKDLEIVVYQMVHFFHQGQLLRMSKRSGNFLALRDVLNLLHKDALRFMMLTKKADTHLDLDVEKIKQQNRENPVFYVQYAYARCCSVMRAAVELFSEQELSSIAEANLELLPQYSLIKILSDWPRQLREAALLREPHRIPIYLHKIAQEFHSLWQKGAHDIQMRFLQKEDLERSRGFMALVQATAYVLAAGLKVLGVSAPSELVDNISSEDAAP